LLLLLEENKAINFKVRNTGPTTLLNSNSV
jgi:hypothetical protein